MEKKKSLVIIPTYNERKNIQILTHQILELYPNMDILVVDDNSPDGTGDFIKEMGFKDKRIRLIQRPRKMGLGTAYVAGFKYMLENNYELAIQMDADFSHDPTEIKTFIELTKENDLIIGSRYIQGVNVINWPMRRLLLSYFANMYTKVITGLPVNDCTGGFKCFKREVLASIDLDSVKSNGYSFQIEMNYRTWKNGFKIIETPIVFTDRTEGHSKMSKQIVYEAVFMVWKLRFSRIINNHQP
jgi:dolichol-phosphate mannosyltransferase